MTEYTNRLSKEKSPYLQQHAHNPVDWYPWGEEAFNEAKRSNKLIFLSIGYSTCHWCHVMERESFDNPDVAKVLNRVFVCIKVDREERPDIDSTYMAVSQMMTGTGGWPLNVILTPDRVPVFALTYIPRESRGGQVGIIDLANQISELWTEGREDVERRAAEVLSNLQGLNTRNSRKKADRAVLQAVFGQMESMYDEANGGFGSSPKFPSPHNLMFLMRYHFRTGNEKALEMALNTLVKMRLGGIFDHIGYGFHRYSTDASWVLPHFEKMIYDQAYLIMAYTEAYQITGEKFYARVAEEIFQFISREMRSPEGAFYTAIDADSEGEEGKFYTWKWQEILTALGQDDADLFMHIFNVDRMGNYHDEASGRITGRNILHMDRTVTEIAKDYGIPVEDLERRLESMRAKLFLARERRARPHMDDKILADMNGLVIAALSRAYRSTGNDKMLDAARKAADFVLSRMYIDGGLKHRYRDGEAAIDAYLDDYSFMAFGLLELFLATMDASYLKRSLEFSDFLKAHFLDSRNGGYFSTPDFGEPLPVRMKEGHDGSVPSGNSVQSLNLLRIGSILSRDDLRADALSVLESFFADMEKSPMFFSFMAIALDYQTSGSYLVKVHSRDGEAGKILDAIWKGFHPNAEVIIVEKGNRELLNLLDEPMEAGLPGSDSIFICTSMNCLPPVDSSDEALRAISK